MNNALILALMTFLFLFLGYSGVPVAFALMAGVIVGTLFTPISLPSLMSQLFNGIDSEALMAIPFFLLVGELMTSSRVIYRIVTLSQALVGHMRAGLAQLSPTPHPGLARCPLQLDLYPATLPATPYGATLRRVHEAHHSER